MPHVFLDGQITSLPEHAVASLAPWRLKGKGVFETMRACDGKIIFLDEHLRRLIGALRRLRVASPFTTAEYREHLFRTLHACRLQNARLRLAVWKEGKRNRASIVTYPYRGYPLTKYRWGVGGMFLTRNIKRGAASAHIKSIDYGVFWKAFQQAQKRGFDEAVLRNSKGCLIEGSRSNIFFFRNGVLYTPALLTGCLAGISRAAVLKIARSTKIRTREGRFQSTELLRADEAFLTNSLIGVMPLTCLGKTFVGNGKPGQLTQRIARAYSRLAKKSVSRR